MKTTKQDLAKQIFELKNELCTLKDQATYEPSAWDVNELARKYNMYELQSKVDDYQKQIRREKHEQAVTEYWENHKSEREQLEQKKIELTSELREAKQQIIDTCNALFAPLHMMVERMGDDHMSVVLIANARYNFDLYFRTDYFHTNENGEHEKTFEMNYPCYGSFDLANDKEHTDYLLAMGVFAGNVVMQNCIKEQMRKMENTCNDYCAKREAIEEQINNPF